MNRFILPLAFLSLIALAGCNFGPSTPTATITPTAGLFIKVPTPSGGPPATSTATLEPITLPPTATFPPPTATPIPTTVSVLPDPAGYAWQEIIAGLDIPDGLVNAGDGSGRLFIIEQIGLISILKDGSLIPSPFLDLTQKVICCGERGLLGLAFHPRYSENGYFFVDYTEEVGNQLYSVIARYSVSSTNPDQADPASELRLLHIEQPYQNHNGGQLQFGPDGYLYIGMGDGGSAGDPHGNGQSLQTLLGKILRIDVDHDQPYSIPPDNPFVNGEGLPEIWAYGLRNPWRFSFDKLTGDLYIADVGQDAWEEIDFLPAGSPGGSNFGWNYYEGNHTYRSSAPAGLNLTMPVAEYSHQLGESVTGGFVYRGGNLPAWYGVYLYGDYGSGRVWGLLRLADNSWQNALMFETGVSISSFGVDENGEIYLVDYSGKIFILQ